MKFKEFKELNYARLAEEILEQWKEEKLFEKSVQNRSEATPFTFYEGPPSANGTPGIHHVMARTVKDVFCRFKTMEGYRVDRKGGWDTHGLPVELQVEKELGITKEDIGTKVSVEDYNKHCREAVMKFKKEWDDLTEKIGYWVDLDDPYITFDNNYIESVWHLLKELYKKGLLYKGYTIQPYSPAAGTGLSSHELNQPGTYRDVKDTSIVAQFKVTRNEKSEFLFDNSEAPVYILAWTTTPWTLPSNAALAVGNNIDYVKVRTENKYTSEPVEVVLAKDLLGKHIDIEKEGNEIIAEYKGRDLVDIEYEQLLPYVQPDRPAFRVIPGDFVSTEDGTGIVHIAPTFGADDQRVAQLADIPAITVKDENDNYLPLVNKQGKFVDEVSDFAGKYVKAEYESPEDVDGDYKSTDVLIAIKLKEENKAFDVRKYEHSYPHCWRTDKPVLYYPLDSWFIRTTSVKDKLVALNKEINWKPEATGTGRFGNWLENLVDWNLSRSRFWGTPLPIWRTEDGTEERCIGSIEELNEAIAEAKAAGFENPDTLEDFHRPYVDDVVLVSSDGRPMRREPDLIDVWFDSGAMPYAQWHFPFENEEKFKANYPADFIAEGVDQTRGWFFTLHAIAVMLYDSVAFKNVIANGLVLDKNGNKMSKRLGNAVDPFETIAKYGPDATRWYMIANAPPWDNLKFDIKGVEEAQRRFFGTYHNTYNFFALYSNIDGFDDSTPRIPYNERSESDQWILSRLHSTIVSAREAYDAYEPTKAARVIQEFTIDDLSNWYVRLNRKRFWRSDYNEDKIAAYQTLLECLETIARLSCIIAPFYFDEVYRRLNEVANLTDNDSVHLADFPENHSEVIDQDLEYRMRIAQKVSSLVHSLRKQESIKVRQPLSKILVPVKDDRDVKLIKMVEPLILTEVNVKEIEYLKDTANVLVKKVKPNFKKLGSVYGKMMKSLAGAINQMSQDDINELDKNGSFSLQVEGQDVTLTPEDVEVSFQDIPGWLVASEDDVTVALDITMTDELKQEGIARDLVNRVQNLRKDMGLDVMDKIKILVKKENEVIEEALNANKDYICTETQALQLSFEEQLNDGTEVEMDEHKIVLKIEL